MVVKVTMGSYKIREILKKIPGVRQLGIWIRRTMLKPHWLYFLRNSTRPLSEQYGFDRGIPLDRYFIESFLETNKHYVKGYCLEIRDNTYTMQYGGEKVTKSDVLDIDADNTNANIIDDLRKLNTIKDGTYDCIILTQVYQFIDDLDSAIAETYRILKPGGTLLSTLPSLSRADCTSGAVGDYWRFTTAGARYLFAKQFNLTDLEIGYHGNVRSGLYFYAGAAIADTPKHVLDTHDEDFSTIVTVLARKD